MAEHIALLSSDILTPDDHYMAITLEHEEGDSLRLHWTCAMSSRVLIAVTQQNDRTVLVGDGGDALRLDAGTGEMEIPGRFNPEAEEGEDGCLSWMISYPAH